MASANFQLVGALQGQNFGHGFRVFHDPIFHDPWRWECSFSGVVKIFVDGPLNVLLLDLVIKQYPKFSGLPVFIKFL